MISLFFFNFQKKIFCCFYIDRNDSTTSIGFYSKKLNVYELVLLLIPRTINTVEGFHRHFNRKNEISYPNIARLITVIIDEEKVNRLSIVKALSDKWNLSKINLQKEKKLSACVKIFNFYGPIVYFNTIGSIYKHEFMINEE